MLKQIDHVALTVQDLAMSVAWYREVLGLERRFQPAWGDRPAMLCAGTTCLALFEQRPVPGLQLMGDSSEARPINHVAFRTDRVGFAAMQLKLKQVGTQFEFQDHRVSHSIYFTDPDGNRLELTTYDLSGESSSCR